MLSKIFGKEVWQDQLRTSPVNTIIGLVVGGMLTTMAKIIGIPSLDDLPLPLTGLGYLIVFFVSAFLIVCLLKLLGVTLVTATPPAIATYAPMPVPPARVLTGYEIEQKLKKCDELLEFVRTQTAAAERGGNELRSNPWLRSRDGTPIVEYGYTYRDDVASLTNRIESLRSELQHHPDIEALLPPLNDMSEFTNSITNFCRAVERLLKPPKISEDDFNFLLETRDLELRQRIIQYAQWRHRATDGLLKMRNKIAS